MWFRREYVPVAQRRAKAQKEMQKLAKKGLVVQPVEIEGRTIAASVWGKGWCTHLESFSDYANRLPRGRTYVRNGSVCHLEVRQGQIEATVSGSELYKIVITIEKLSAAKWKAIKERCAGQIGTMLELLQGKFSREVMGIVSDRDTGLFPKPKEIKLSCSCPDWAVMCKHVAAALYGVGNRLDQQPELLFVLRGVDPQELVSGEIALPSASAEGEDTLSSEVLGDIFGIELDPEPVSPEPVKVPSRSRKKPARTTPAPEQPSEAPKQTRAKRAPAQKWQAATDNGAKGSSGASAPKKVSKAGRKPAKVTTPGPARQPKKKAVAARKPRKSTR